jgi:hypothetical protein
VPGLPVEVDAAAAASSAWDFVLQLRRRGGACSGAAVELWSLYRSWFGPALTAEDQRTVRSASDGVVCGRRIWFHSSTTLAG